MTVTEGDVVLDEIQFDDANIMRREGATVVISRDIMRNCASPGLWHRVTHAAASIAETGSLAEYLETSLRAHREPPE